jgi:solute carrier family 25 (mitochondrial S-adenosylmethionine transporter), member 26
MPFFAPKRAVGLFVCVFLVSSHYIAGLIHKSGFQRFQQHVNQRSKTSKLHDFLHNEFLQLSLIEPHALNQFEYISKLQSLFPVLTFKLQTNQIDVASTSSSLQCASQFNTVAYATSGGLAGAFRSLSRVFTYPFDTVKTIEQCDAELRPKQINYFRGMWLSTLAAIPANAIFFVIYYFLEHWQSCTHLIESSSNSATSSSSVSASSSLLDRLFFSALATIPQNLIKVPAEVVKQRTQIKGTQTIVEVGKELIEQEGWAGLYRGSNALLIREIPYNSLQMVFYEALMEYQANGLMTLLSLDHKIIASIFGLFAASLAAFLTQPADVIKTKLMTATSSTEEEEKAWQIQSLLRWSEWSIVQACQSIYQTTGWKGFFAGLLPRLGIVSIGGMVYFFGADLFQESLK